MSIERFVFLGVLAIFGICHGLPTGDTSASTLDALQENITALWQEVQGLKEALHTHINGDGQGSSNTYDNHHEYHGNHGDEHHDHHHEGENNHYHDSSHYDHYHGGESDHHHDSSYHDHPHEGENEHYHGSSDYDHHHEGESDHHHDSSYHDHHHGSGDHDHGHEHYDHDHYHDNSFADDHHYDHFHDSKHHHGYHDPSANTEENHDHSSEHDPHHEHGLGQGHDDEDQDDGVVKDSGEETKPASKMGCKKCKMMKENGCKKCKMMKEMIRRMQMNGGAHSDTHQRGHSHTHHSHHHEQEMLEAHCHLMPNVEVLGSNVSGHITITQKGDGKGPLYFDLDLTGFDVSKASTGGIHGFHVHENQIQDQKCSTAGPHFNPSGSTHGARDDTQRHVGDLGNIKIDNEGKIENYILTDDVVQFAGRNSIVGRSIVVHELPDDLGRGGDEGSLKTGNAGARLACCVIEGKNIPSAASPAIRFNG